MHQKRKIQSGFSLIEMLIATVLVLFLTGTSYKILTGQGKVQKDSVFAQKQNTQANRVLDLFKKDASLIDDNWIKYNIPIVYAHQGLGLGENYYLNSLIKPEGLNDGVTFLRKNNQKSKAYSLKVTAEYPTANAGSSLLYSQYLDLDAGITGTTDIQIKDWVLVFSAGKYVIAKVTGVTASPARIRLTALSSTAETAAMHLNTVVNRNSGYVTRSGVVPASFDWNNLNTLTLADGQIRFDENKTYVQVVVPVSYELDWTTSNGQRAGGGNQHLLDEDGNPRKTIVRTEYLPNGPVREYVGEAKTLGITYDVLKNGASGEIDRNVGRGNDTVTKFLNVSSPAPNDPTMGDAFISTPNIIAMNMILDSDLTQGQESNEDFNEVHASLGSLKENVDKMDGNGGVLAHSSKNLTYNLTGKKMGQPLYLSNNPNTSRSTADKQLAVPGSGVDIVVPVSIIDPLNSAPENGSLLVMDKNGDPSTSANEIRFTSPLPDTYFMPTTLVHGSPQAFTTNKIFVGGFAVHVDPVTQARTRVPMVATIDYPKGTKFRDFVAANNNGGGATCSLNINCTLKEIKTTDIAGFSDSPDRLKDTSSIAVDNTTGAVYFASITRTRNKNPIGIYESNASLTTFTEKRVSAGSQFLVTSAISSPIEINNIKYLPVATSRNLQSASPAIDGKILLYNLTNTSAPPVVLANHNYKVNSMSTAGDGNLVFTGKLVTQIMRAEDIQAIVNGTVTTPSTFYTDEIARHEPANGVDPAKDYFADGFYTLSQGYQNKATSQFQQVFGWNTGANVVKASNNSYLMVMANQAHAEDINGPYEQNDFTTVSFNLSGSSSETILASIDTDYSNLQASDVTVSYQQQRITPSGVVLPGVLYYDNGLSARTTVAPLPDLKNNSMDESKWVGFYQDFVESKDYMNSSPIQYLPDPTQQSIPCGTDKSFPSTCM